MDIAIYIAISVLLIVGVSYSFFFLIRRNAAAKRMASVEPGQREEIRTLSISREQFRRLFEEAPVPYFILDKKANIKDVNKAVLRFFHASSDEVITKNFFSFAYDEDADYASYLLTCCLRGLPIDKKEIRMFNKNGEPRWVQISILGLAEPNVEDSSNLATIFDITDQKNLDKAKTEFVSLASHQLRSPLVSVKWYTEMLQHPTTGELNQKQKDYVRIISEVNGDMIDLVDTLLNVSRIDIGKIVVDIEPTNVQKVVESILTELSTQIEKKKMNIIKAYDNLFLDIKIDPKLLRIVIHNLITNAIKYTPDGGDITIKFMESVGKKQIVVADTGLGIPKNQQDKVFTKMFRADNVKNVSIGQSTGLGLYLVKSLVEAMGGDISFQSEENKGTSFILTFS